MSLFRCLAFCVLFVLGTLHDCRAAGRYFVVEYPASTETRGLQMGVTYTLWVPDDVKTLRGVIVHQHGCGTGACQGGETAAYDFHWQALAKKWDCALLGPSYHQAEQQNCRLWCDPRNGSAATFLKSLEDFADQAQRPELRRVPWCIWGHSGGGFWGSLMQTLYPERIVALWHRSGGAINAWAKDEIPRPEFPAEAFRIPTMCNPGLKERDDPRMVGAWTAGTGLFHLYRTQGAPIGFAADPRSSHECADSRYLAIPFFDACLEQRLPEPGSDSQTLRPVDPQQAWLSTLSGSKPVPAAEFKGLENESVWLPNGRFAALWEEYIRVGSVSDSTPPPAPSAVRIRKNEDGAVELTWEAEADFESGIRCFLIRKNGSLLAQYPEKPVGRYGRPLFQSMSYHDTPEKPLLPLKYVDQNAQPGADAVYEVVTVNSVGLESAPAKP
ncbi:hypothetical protein [Schlesneria sp. T3-172]|uniref:hypothetical protein n=1 Tax=Schlesneria sphaerica TaxID=3373610 RepID=UPI0037C9B3FD